MYIQDFIIFNDYCLLMCIVPLLVSVATLIQFVYFVLLIRIRLQLLAHLLANHKLLVVHHFHIQFHARLAAVAEEQDVQKKLDLRLIQKLYGTLYKALQMLNSVFGIQLVVMITAQFITLTTLSYFICMQVIRWVME